MKFYWQDNEDKLNALNRSFFDAEHGWVTLAFERLDQLCGPFPNDPQVRYAEGLIRKDFLGQGIGAQECFLHAQQLATKRTRDNENYLFTTFNAAKYARNLAEFRQQEKIARNLAPDDPDLELFNQINHALAQGNTYADVLANAAGEYQQHGRWGDCAAFAELALQAGQQSLEEELMLRRCRLQSLRELDKMAEASRGVRGEEFPPAERLSLHEAMAEMESALKLDPKDHMLWNFKSGWLYLLDKPSEAIACADQALAICPTGYVKPLTNKALGLQRVGQLNEAREVANRALVMAQSLGAEGRGDVELSKRILAGLTAPTPPDDQALGAVAERFISAAHLTSRQEITQWKGGNGGSEVLAELKRRVSIAGTTWGPQYPKLMAELLTFFCAETAWITTASIGDRNPEELQHCFHAVLQLAAQADNPMSRDACRFLVFQFLASATPTEMRLAYRKAILGPSAVGSGEFLKLDQLMRDEMTRMNSALVKLMAVQSPLSKAELSTARTITMARFTEGVSRDLSQTVQRRSGFLRSVLRRFFGMH